jgi:hypothetical protein
MIKNIYNNNNNLSFRRQNPKLKHQKMSKWVKKSKHPYQRKDL